MSRTTIQTTTQTTTQTTAETPVVPSAIPRQRRASADLAAVQSRPGADRTAAKVEQARAGADRTAATVAAKVEQAAARSAWARQRPTTGQGDPVMAIAPFLRGLR